MKSYILYLKIFFIVTMLLSCQEDETDNLSIVTTYPQLSFNGRAVIAHPVGTPYTDDGVTATIGDAPVEYETEGSVDDVNTVGGIHSISYTATNAEGYSVTITRQVVIVDPTADAGVDLSGEYIRNATGVVVTVEKAGPNLYSHSNVGGFAGTVLDVYFVHVEGTELVIPLQVAPASSVAVESIPGSGGILIDAFQWKINAAGFGVGNRLFEKI